MDKKILTLDEKIVANLPLTKEENEILVKRITAEWEKENKEKIEEVIPQPKSYEEKLLSGEEPLPKELKIVNGNLEYKTEYELYKEGIISKEDFSAYKRMIRDDYLANTDKYLLADYPITEEELIKVKAYRVYLRDITKEEKFPDIEVMTLEEFKKI